MMDSEARHRVTQQIRLARAYAAEQLPWFSRALYSAQLVMSDQLDAPAAVDEAMRVYFNPQRVAELITHAAQGNWLPELGFLWVHEISHVIRNHSARFRELGPTDEPQTRQSAKASQRLTHACATRRRQLIFNLAADAEINDAEFGEQLVPPTHFPPVLPSLFGMEPGELAEKYYRHLQESGDADRLLVQTGYGYLVNYDEGSGVCGSQREWELSGDDAQSPGLNAQEVEMLRVEVAAEIQRAKSSGNRPGASWLRWAHEHLNPQVDWRKLLARRMRSATAETSRQRSDYSYRRPHRRSAIYAPTIRPALVAQPQCRTAVLLDTSGSMSGTELNHALAEVRGALRSLRSSLTVIPFDVVDYAPILVNSKEGLVELPNQLTGGGGSSGLEAALLRAHALRPPYGPINAILVLTDGALDYPAADKLRALHRQIGTVYGVLTSSSASSLRHAELALQASRPVAVVPIVLGR